MNAAQAKALEEPFPEESIGKLPKLTCKACSDKRCQEHRKQRCAVCGNYISTAHIDLDYVGHAATTKRLLSVDPGWTWEPLAVSEQGLPVFDAKNGLWIKLTICGVTRLGYGDGASPKEVIGDAIRNAAMRFGVALDLWAKEDLSNIAASTPPAGGEDVGGSTVVAHTSLGDDAQVPRDGTTPATSAVAGLAAAATAEEPSGADEEKASASDPTVAQDLGPQGDEEGAEPEAINPEGVVDGSAYLTAEQGRAMVKLYTSSKKLVDAAREVLGVENVRRPIDLTVDQARRLTEHKAAAA